MPARRKTETSKLPRGRHGIPRELIAENQRARLAGGMIDAVAEYGYGKATVAKIVAAAKVSRRTFYEYFANKEECYRAAYEESFELLRGTVETAVAESEDWANSLRGGLESLLRTLAANPNLASFFLISPAGVGDEIATRHHLAIRELVGVLLTHAPGRRGDRAAEIQAEALAGGLFRLTSMKVGVGEAAGLPDLLPDLIELFLRPFVGSEQAIRAARGE